MDSRPIGGTSGWQRAATGSGSCASSRRPRPSCGGWRKDLLPTCQRHRMGAIAWSPCNAGWLTGKYRKGEKPPEGSPAARGRMARFDAPENDRKLDLFEELAKVAADAGVTLTRQAQAFVVGHRAVTSAIIGPAPWTS